MAEIIVLQKPLFIRAFKRMHKNEQEIVEQAIEDIVANPDIGERKKGDLALVYVYKFKLKTKEFLLGYKWDPSTRVLLALGVHENFYRDLKRNNL